MRVTLQYLLVGFALLFPFAVAHADELVVNGDTGVNAQFIQNRMDLAGAKSFVPQQHRATGVQRGEVPDGVASGNVMRFSARQAAPVDRSADALANIAPAAGGAAQSVPVVRTHSDGGALATLPLTPAEEYARKHNAMRFEAESR